MAFWGVEVKPTKPFTLKPAQTRLHLSQATLGLGNDATTRCCLQCIVGNKSPVLLCALDPEKADTCQLNMEFEEADDVIFSVLGPRSIHLTGYFLGRPSSCMSNDDESESFGEDIAGSDMEKPSSDDYDYRDSFISDDRDDQMCIKELTSKRKDKKSNVKGRRLRKMVLVSDSESGETSAKHDDSSNGDSVPEMKISSEVPLPSRVTSFEKPSEVKTHLAKSEDKPLGGDVVYSFGFFPKKEETVVLINSDDEALDNEKSAGDKGTKASSDVLPSQNGDATQLKKKRKRDRKGEAKEIDKNFREGTDTKKPLESEITSNEMIIEHLEEGNVDGKLAVKGKKVSIQYTAKLKDTGKLFASNLGEDPLRFRLDGKKVIKGLSIGVEGMRVGDKRRLIIPPSLGYSEEGLEDVVPKNAWLVYEVLAVKI